MDNKLILHNRLKEARVEKSLSQAQLAELVGVSRNTISSIETGQFNPTAKLALILCIALDKNLKICSILNENTKRMLLLQHPFSMFSIRCPAHSNTAYWCRYHKAPR